MIGDDRGDQAPPVDALAERLVLQHVLFYPHELDRLDIGHLFVLPKSQRVWQALVRASNVCQTLDGVDFYRCWLADLQSNYGDGLITGWVSYWDYVMDTDLESARAWEEVEEQPHHEDGRLMLSEYRHGFEWWVHRLAVIHHARERIHALQAIAERAWQEPDQPFTREEFLEMIDKLEHLVAPDTEAVGMDIPV